jgi:hypothetical protein
MAHGRRVRVFRRIMFGIRFRLVLDIPFYVPFFLRDGKPDPEGKTKHEGGNEKVIGSRLS